MRNICGAGLLACRRASARRAAQKRGGSPEGLPHVFTGVFLAAAVFALVALAGCGYHVAANADLLPKSLKTIAVPAFTNGTTRYDLARMLPEDIGREFLSRTRYRVVSDPEQADAILTGTLVRFTSSPSAADTSGRATAVRASVILQVTLKDRATGTVLFTRTNFEFKESYAISVSPQDYFDESGVAMMRLSKSVADSVVTAILANF